MTSMKLNIGCGTHLLDSYINVDFYPRNDKIQKDDIMALSYGDSTFDEVLCNNVLEHIENPKKAITECRRVLKPGGLFHGEVPLYHPYHSKQDYWRFTHQGLGLLLKDFKNVKIERFDGNLAVIGIFMGSQKKLPRRFFEWLDRRHRFGKHSTTKFLFNCTK